MKYKFSITLKNGLGNDIYRDFVTTREAAYLIADVLEDMIDSLEIINHEQPTTHPKSGDQEVEPSA